MAEVKMPTTELGLPGNSHAQNSANNPDERPKIKKIAQGKIKKKPVSRKFADLFFGEEVVDVKGYILQDVLVPAIKDTISDVVTGGIDMLLFGERRARGGRSVSSTPRTNYSSCYGNGHRGGTSGSDSSVKRVYGQYSIEDIILRSRPEAEEVLGNMIDSIKDYGMVSVAELYDMVGIPGAFTDNSWGWFDLGKAGVRRVREGYLLILPKIQSLK